MESDKDRFDEDFFGEEEDKEKGVVDRKDEGRGSS